MDMSTLANPMSTSFTKIEVCYQKAEQNLLVLLWNYEVVSPKEATEEFPTMWFCPGTPQAKSVLPRYEGQEGENLLPIIPAHKFSIPKERHILLEVYNKLFVLRKYSFTFNKSYDTVGRLNTNVLQKRKLWKRDIKNVKE